MSTVDPSKNAETERVSDVAADKAREAEPENNEPTKLYDEDEYNEEEDGDFVSER